MKWFAILLVCTALTTHAWQPGSAPKPNREQLKKMLTPKNFGGDGHQVFLPQGRTEIQRWGISKAKGFK
jgi:hypothetical protein